MSSNMLLYSLGGASMFFAIIVTILNALAYGVAQSLSSSTPATERTPVSLSVVNCVALIMISLLVHQDIRQNHQWPRWKVWVFSLTVAYLIIAAGSTAGTMATNHNQPSLWIARSIFWGISVFTQGSYCGYLLMICFQQRPESAWPHSYNLSEELKTLPETPTSVTNPVQVCDPYPDMNRFDTRRGSLRKFPRRSNRDSGLCLELSKPKNGSFDTTSTTSSAEQSPTKQQHQQHQQPQSPQDYINRTLLRGNGSIRSMPSLRHDPTRQPSLDTLVTLVQPSPTASTFHLDSPTGSMETLTVQEHNIHPLFRSTSPCPSPTPTPGTRVKASPSAGQTITHQTLTRMRSARSLRESRPLPSPFLSDEELAQARKEPESGLLPFIDAGHVRRSITQYEKRYDLYESPDEN
ncbi:hypothetical protein N7466_006902 [Penicillium verhagenii]|uniref:uncharacterized protein n=1 Tax=Penicillium verhagenii TaxID=1562060 RepID=UPI00254593F1|nr:uncharacterized protein N7466_006902 [Penicillium verhagenii]KAJ5927946.1 hypothetical protein N7466_006902 [Penicillium verhagenii]